MCARRFACPNVDPRGSELDKKESIMKRLLLMSLTATIPTIAFRHRHTRRWRPRRRATRITAASSSPTGFCALVVADNIGPARHLTVAQNGDLFVALEDSRGKRRRHRRPARQGRRRPHGCHRAIRSGRGTGIEMRKGYLYFATTTSVMRYKMGTVS